MACAVSPMLLLGSATVFTVTCNLYTNFFSLCVSLSLYPSFSSVVMFRRLFGCHFSSLYGSLMPSRIAFYMVGSIAKYGTFDRYVCRFGKSMLNRNIFSLIFELSFAKISGKTESTCKAHRNSTSTPYRIVYQTIYIHGKKHIRCILWTWSLSYCEHLPFFLGYRRAFFLSLDLVSSHFSDF